MRARLPLGGKFTIQHEEKAKFDPARSIELGKKVQIYLTENYQDGLAGRAEAKYLRALRSLNN